MNHIDLNDKHTEQCFVDLRFLYNLHQFAMYIFKTWKREMCTKKILYEIPTRAWGHGSEHLPHE